jgi:nucleoid-associated protein YgaU
MIVIGSRYYGQPVMTVNTAEGTSVAVFGPPVSGPNTFVYYTVQQGDRMDTIAYAVYGVPDYWWKIADSNPEIFYPDGLTPGSVIRIPATSS